MKTIDNMKNIFFTSIACALLLLTALYSPALAQESANFADGGTQIGYDSRACIPTMAGTIRYSSTAGTTGPSDMTNNWTMDDTSGTAVVDSVGGNNGLWTGSAAVNSVTGQINTALYFNGSTYVVVPDAAVLEVQASMTVSMWVKFDTGSLSAKQTLALKSHSVSPYLGWGMEIDATGYPNFYVANTAASYFTTTGPKLNANTWYLLTAVKSGNDLSFYMNGIQNESYNDSPITGTVQTSTDSALGIGANGTNGADPVHGIIDDMRIYNRALSAAEIYALYDEGINGGSSGCLEYCNGNNWVCP